MCRGTSESASNARLTGIMVEDLGDAVAKLERVKRRPVLFADADDPKISISDSSGMLGMLADPS